MLFCFYELAKTLNEVDRVWKINSNQVFALLRYFMKLCIIKNLYLRSTHDCLNNEDFRVIFKNCLKPDIIHETVLKYIFSNIRGNNNQTCLLFLLFTKH